jgi:hypothetical protein
MSLFPGPAAVRAVVIRAVVIRAAVARAVLGVIAFARWPGGGTVGPLPGGGRHGCVVW